VSQPVVVPGTRARRRRRPTIDWELIDCGLQGHRLVGTDVARISPDDHVLVRESGGVRFYRCLRCDAWVTAPAVDPPARTSMPPIDEIDIPLRGRPLRDRFVLRLISVERAVHVVILALLVVVVFLFAAHHATLRGYYTRILTDLQDLFGGTTGRRGVLADLNRLFALSTTVLYLIGVGLALYTALLVAETVGLWLDRRWAEYLTFVETAVLVPYEIYELARGVTPFKVLTFVVNVAILTYLALGHRLFGLRGGAAAVEARRAEASGWEALVRATPEPAATPVPAGVAPGPAAPGPAGVGPAGVGTGTVA
jgi:uncharacterized membrane protein (DUF2068 family)